MIACSNLAGAGCRGLRGQAYLPLDTRSQRMQNKDGFQFTEYRDSKSSREFQPQWGTIVRKLRVRKSTEGVPSPPPTAERETRGND